MCVLSINNPRILKNPSILILKGIKYNIYSPFSYQHSDKDVYMVRRIFHPFLHYVVMLPKGCFAFEFIWDQNGWWDFLMDIGKCCQPICRVCFLEFFIDPFLSFPSVQLSQHVSEMGSDWGEQYIWWFKLLKKDQKNWANVIYPSFAIDGSLEGWWNKPLI